MINKNKVLCVLILLKTKDLENATQHLRNAPSYIAEYDNRRNLIKSILNYKIFIIFKYFPEVIYFIRNV